MNFSIRQYGYVYVSQLETDITARISKAIGEAVE